MISMFWLKFIGIGALGLLVVGNLLYIRDLQKTNEINELKIEAQARTINSLNEKQSDNDRIEAIIGKIDELGSLERQQLARQRTNQINQIDTKVTEGKDKPVGPLLKEFLNGE